MMTPGLGFSRGRSVYNLAMRLNNFRKALLILALVLSQWLVAAHGLQHAGLAHEHACKVCLHAQGLDTGPIMLALPSLSLPRQVERIAEPPSAPLLQLVDRSYPIRGPPSLFV